MRELTWKEKREQRRIQREGWKEMKEREKENPQPREPIQRKPARHERDPYEFRTVRRMKDTKRLMKKGWEVVESSGSESFWGNSYKAIMRQPNPHYKEQK